jgi:hypothetical protein
MQQYLYITIFTVLCEVSAYITDLDTLYYFLLTFSFMTIDINLF